MKTRIPHAGLFGVLIATPVLMCLALFVLASTLSAQSGGQNSISRKKPFTGSTGSSSGSVLEHFTISNGQLVGRTSAGVLSGLTIGSGLSLSGTTLSAAAPTVAIGDVTGLQTALDGKASLSGTYANPSWITSLPFSKLTGLPSTLAGHGITEFATNAFKLLPSVPDTLQVGDLGLGTRNTKMTLGVVGNSEVQFYTAGTPPAPVMSFGGTIICNKIEANGVTFIEPCGTNSPPSGAEIGQAFQDGASLFIKVGFNQWLKFTGTPFTP